MDPVTLNAFTALNSTAATVIHLGHDQADRALCGVHRGQPVPVNDPARLCGKCVYRHQQASGQARKIARQAADQAVRQHIANHATPRNLQGTLTDHAANTGYLGQLGHLAQEAKRALAETRRLREER